MRSHQNILILPKPTIIQNNIHTKHTHTCTEYVYICFFFPFWTSGTWLFLSHRAKWRCDNQKGKRTPKQYVRPKDIHDTYQNCDKTIHRNRTHIHPACNKINDKYSSNNNQIKKKPKYTTPKPTTKREQRQNYTTWFFPLLQLIHKIILWKNFTMKSWIVTNCSTAVAIMPHIRIRIICPYSISVQRWTPQPTWINKKVGVVLAKKNRNNFWFLSCYPFVEFSPCFSVFCVFFFLFLLVWFLFFWHHDIGYGLSLHFVYVCMRVRAKNINWILNRCKQQKFCSERKEQQK